MVLFPAAAPLRRGFSVLAAVGALAAFAVPVAAAPSSPTDQYLSLRRAYPPKKGLTPRTLAAQPEAHRGATLEIEGRLTGIIRREDGTALMLATDDSPTLTLYMDAAPDWLQPGSRLRVLAVAVPPEEAGEGEGTQTVVVGVPVMRVVAVASAADVANAEARWAQTAATRDARTGAALRAAEAALTGRRASSRPVAVSRASSRRAPAALASRGAGSGLVRSNGTLVGQLSPDAQAAYPHYLAFIKSHNRRLTDTQADAITASVLLFSERYQVDPRLVVALIIAESDFKPGTTSHKGAMGLGQIMPDEARTLGLTNPYDPVQNVAGAVYLLRGRLDKYSGGAELSMRHIILALASYNAGMGAVKKYGGVPPYRETRNYVKKIERLYRQLCGMG